VLHLRGRSQYGTVSSAEQHVAVSDKSQSAVVVLVHYTTNDFDVYISLNSLVLRFLVIALS